MQLRYTYIILGFILGLAILARPAFAQRGSLVGTVAHASTQSPVADANVSLEGTSLGSITSDKGAFQLKKIPAGTYRLVITHINFDPWYQTVSIQPNQSSELNVRLTEASNTLSDIVVTATRTERSVDEVPMPVQVITEEQIDQIGSLRLNEVLQEQTGLQMISDHGSGLQMQGLSSDYILILIDGEPVIGRTAGTVDLTRLTVNNIARIEIIRGPASSLYGSEAMAGVVNIITKGNEPGWNGAIGTQYRSFGTWDAQADAGYRGERFSARVSVNHLSSEGYDLTPETVSQTLAPFQALTLAPKVAYRINDQLNFRVSGRFYREQRQDVLDITENDTETRLNSEDRRSDWNLLPILEYRPNDQHKFQFRHYLTGYQTESSLTYQTDESIYDLSTFNQTFTRSEVQYDWYQSDQFILTGGAGYLREQVDATRYADVNQFTSTYTFAQSQWQPTEAWNVVAGARYDAHSAYANRLSPKLSIGYTPNKWLSVQASFGGGYKAPDFRQLLLAFTNPVGGYSVLGSQVVQEEFAKLQAQGQIAQVLIDPATVEEIQAESSLAYNLGFKINPNDQLSWQTNLFRNNVQDLIETAPIARKTNGQQVFSYFNYAEVITQGVETQIDYRLLPGFTLSAGYQYLDTRDEEAYQNIQDGEVYRRDASNRTERVTTADYGGLFNRSRHSGNAKVFYTNSRYDFDIALRGIYRGRWGIGDFNGNSVLDAENEYADGYWLVNLAVHKNLGESLRLETGVNNLLGQTTVNEPSLAGRIFFAGVHWSFNTMNNEQ